MRHAILCCLICLLSGATLRAQDFPAGWSLPLELGQGFNRPRGGPELYLATVQLVPQYTLVPGRLRAGAVLGTYYPSRQLGALAGPRLTLKLLQGKPVLTGTSFNVHLLAEYLWATASGLPRARQLLGGGIGAESSNLVGLSLKFHRDLNLPTTYVQLALTYNLVKRRIPDL